MSDLLSDPRFAALARQGQRKMAEAGAPVEGAVLPPLSPTHEAVGGLVDELLGLVERLAVNAPPTLRPMVGLVLAQRHKVVDGLASMPAEQLAAYLRVIRDRIDTVPGVSRR